jgi:hypothetical protein
MAPAMKRTAGFTAAPKPLLNKPDLGIPDLDIFKVAAPPSGYPENVRTFYSPIDWVHPAIETVLSSAQR